MARPWWRCRASPARFRSSTSRVTERLPGQDLRPKVLDPLLDNEHRVDAVEAPRVLAEELPLHRLRDGELGHRIQRVPDVLGVVMRIIGRPDPHVLVEVPHAVDRLLVALERDEAAPIERLVGICDRPFWAALARLEVEDVPAAA